MTREEKQKAIYALKISAPIGAMTREEFDTYIQTINTVMDWLEQEACEDCISRQAAKKALEDRFMELQKIHSDDRYETNFCLNTILELPPVTPQPGHCKECKYFEYDSVAKVDGMPLIVAHEICKRWGDGCKTKEDGYCFLFEPQIESEA